MIFTDVVSAYLHNILNRVSRSEELLKVNNKAKYTFSNDWLSTLKIISSN